MSIRSTSSSLFNLRAGWQRFPGAQHPPARGVFDPASLGFSRRQSSHSSAAHDTSRCFDFDTIDGHRRQSRRHDRSQHLLDSADLYARLAAPIRSARDTTCDSTEESASTSSGRRASTCSETAPRLRALRTTQAALNSARTFASLLLGLPTGGQLDRQWRRG